MYSPIFQRETWCPFESRFQYLEVSRFVCCFFNVYSSLPQYRLGTVSSEEELRNKLADFNKARLVELLDAEKKIKEEAIERANQAEKKLSDKKAFYRIVRNWWKEFNSELAILTHQDHDLTYHFPTEQEIEEEHEKIGETEEVVRIFGEKFRSMNDFTFSCVKKLTEKVEDERLRALNEETTKKNRELTAELENMENDLEEKTELAEDLRLRKVHRFQILINI